MGLARPRQAARSLRPAPYGRQFPTSISCHLRGPADTLPSLRCANRTQQVAAPMLEFAPPRLVRSTQDARRRYDALDGQGPQSPLF